MKYLNKILSFLLCFAIIVISISSIVCTVNITKAGSAPVYSDTDSHAAAVIPEAEKPVSSQEQIPDSDDQSNTPDIPNQTAEDEKPTKDQQTAANTNTKEIKETVDLYNTAVNKVKSEAKKIVRHYEHMSSDENYFEMPSAISGIAKTAMGMFIKGSDEEQIWTTADDFKLGFPVSGEDYTSHLKPEMVKTATCQDTGNAYDIDIVLYDDAITSPAKGEGYAGVFTTVTADTITGVSVPGVTFEKVDVNGINGHITCKIDKATKRVTDIVFTNTDVLDMSVKVIKQFDVKFALACERSYSVEY